MYQIIKVTRTHHGTLTITKERTVNHTASQADVDKILSLPESYEGERDEALDDLASGGITNYHGFMIIEH